MTKNIRVIFVILVLLLIVFTSLVVRFWLQDDVVLIKDQPEAPTISYLGGSYYSYGMEGYYGVKNNNGKVLVEAHWKSIDMLDSDRFAVSGYISGGIRYGIIDVSENVVVPFIYTDFEQLGREFIIAETEKKKFVLFDFSGNAVVRSEFDRISKNYPTKSLSAPGNYIQLEDGTDMYRISINKEGQQVMSELRIYRDVLGEERLVKISNSAVVPGLAEIGGLYSEVFDVSLEYIDAVFAADSSRIKNISWNPEYRDLLLEGHSLRGSTILSVETPVPVISDETDGTVEYQCRTQVVYESPDSVQWGGSYTNSEHTMNLQINLKKNESGRLAVYKVFASKLS